MGKASTSPKRGKKIALGKGLGALIPETKPAGSDRLFMCPVDQIRPNRYQPRVKFSESELDDLTHSIRTQGVIQPLLVKKDNTGWELIAGERRLRAAKKAGLKTVPVVVKEVGDSELLEMSIIENIQRENLNPIEEADAYHHLMSRFGMTQEQVAQRVGKSRSAVANFLRLRQLPDPVKETIMNDTLSMGHARALLGADTPARLTKAFRMVVANGLSVRETENLVKRLASDRAKPSKRKASSNEIYFSGIADDLSRHFGTRVQIKRKGKIGRVEVEFYSDDDLDRILNLLHKP